MAITIGTATLNSHISWRGHFNEPGVPGSEVSTLGGNTIINRLIGNTTDIVLESIEEDNIRKGYFESPELEILSGYRDSGTSVVLNYHGTVVNVIVKTDGINVEKVLWKSINDNEEKYIGTITLKRT